MNIRFLIIVTGWNCKDHLERCYKSIRNQDHKNFRAVFILDGATDGGEELLQTVVVDKRFTIEIHKENMGAAYRRFYAIHRYGERNDVIVLVGMDDKMFGNSLTRISKEYAAGKWMTYGDWIDQKGERLPPGFLHFDQQTHDQRSYRKVKYRSTAPNTFYKFLFDQIPAEDFQINGKWIDSTTESELMFSCLEMCGQKRIGVIEDPIYFYNRNLPNGTLARLGTQYKYSIYEQIIQRPIKPLYEDIMKQENETYTKTTKSKWESATRNLQARRDTGVTDNAKCDSIVADYYRHMRSFSCGMNIGKSVLDVGCGSQSLRKVIEIQHPGVRYVGIDAFPIEGIEYVVKCKIENDKEVEQLANDWQQESGTRLFDTVVCFAALDSMHDLVKATANMKSLAKERVCFLTGIGIEPDQYHTFKITTELLDQLMSGWKVVMSNFLTEKVLLIEYVPA